MWRDAFLLDIDYFREELETLKARLDLTVVHVLANPPAGWTGEQGFINAKMFRRHLPPPRLATRRYGHSGEVLFPLDWNACRNLGGHDANGLF
jgi:Oxidoreductase NAD-binding domain